VRPDSGTGWAGLRLVESLRQGARLVHKITTIAAVVRVLWRATGRRHDQIDRRLMGPDSATVRTVSKRLTKLREVDGD